MECEDGIAVEAYWGAVTMLSEVSMLLDLKIKVKYKSIKSCTV